MSMDFFGANEDFIKDAEVAFAQKLADHYISKRHATANGLLAAIILAKKTDASDEIHYYDDEFGFEYNIEQFSNVIKVHETKGEYKNFFEIHARTIEEAADALKYLF